MKRIKATEMIIPKVLNKYRDEEEIKSLRPDQYVNIMRPSKWSNPFPLRKGATDEERKKCLIDYSEWLVENPMLLDSIGELTGKFLICCCKPKDCHGDILLALANPEKEESAKPQKIQRVKAVVNIEQKEVPEVTEKTKKQKSICHSAIDKRFDINSTDTWELLSIKEESGSRHCRVQLFEKWINKDAFTKQHVVPTAFDGWCIGYLIGKAIGEGKIQLPPELEYIPF